MLVVAIINRMLHDDEHKETESRTLEHKETESKTFATEHNGRAIINNAMLNPDVIIVIMHGGHRACRRQVNRIETHQKSQNYCSHNLKAALTTQQKH